MSDLERKESHRHKPTNLEKKTVSDVSGIISKAILLICVMVGLSACAPAVYHVNLKYDPAGKSLKQEKTGPDFPVTVAMFNDIRKIDDKLLLGRVMSLDGDRIPIFPKYSKVTEAVTTSIREYLFKSGYKVSNEIPVWDLKEEKIGKDWGRILIGGNIDDLEIVCEKSFPVITYQVKAKLTLVFANVPDKRVFYRASVENSNSLKDVSFSEELLEEQINAVLSEALEKMFNDPKMKKTIEEGAKIKK
jgi:hypothetical protein